MSAPDGSPAATLPADVSPNGAENDTGVASLDALTLDAVALGLVSLGCVAYVVAGVARDLLRGLSRG